MGHHVILLIADNSIGVGGHALPSALPPPRRDVRIVKRVADVVLSGKCSAPASMPCAVLAGEYIGPEIAVGHALGAGWTIVSDCVAGAGWLDVAPASALGPLYAKTLAARAEAFVAEPALVRAVWGMGYERDVTIGHAAHDRARAEAFVDRCELVYGASVIVALRLPHPGQTEYEASDLMTVTTGRQALAAERSNVVLIDWSAAEISADDIHPTADGYQTLGTIAGEIIRDACPIDECLTPLFDTHPEAFGGATGAYLPWGALPSAMLCGQWWLRWRGDPSSLASGVYYLAAFGTAPAIRIDVSSGWSVNVSAGNPSVSGDMKDVSLAGPATNGDVDVDVVIDFEREGGWRSNNVALRIDGVEVARSTLDRDWRHLTPSHALMPGHRDNQWVIPGEVAFYRGHP